MCPPPPPPPPPPHTHTQLANSQSEENNKISSTSDSGSWSSHDQKQFISHLEEAITDSSTNKLWKMYAHRFTLQFKEYALESKVQVFSFCCMSVGMFLCEVGCLSISSLVVRSGSSESGMRYVSMDISDRFHKTFTRRFYSTVINDITCYSIVGLQLTQSYYHIDITCYSIVGLQLTQSYYHIDITCYSIVGLQLTQSYYLMSIKNISIEYCITQVLLYLHSPFTISLCSLFKSRSPRCNTSSLHFFVSSPCFT